MSAPPPPGISPATLLDQARAVMRANGFTPDIPADAAAEAATAQPPANAPDAAARDLRALPWSSIDDAGTRDLDQVEVAERLPDGRIRVRVGIADVDAVVRVDDAIDRFARESTTSVYTAARTFPMLPERLSTDITSLVADADRRAIVMEFVVAADGHVADTDAYPALVRNRAKLAYDDVSAWLEQRGPLPAAAGAPEIADQLALQHEAATRLRAQRVARGALEIATSEEVTPLHDAAGTLVGLAPVEHGPARDLIEDFMIAANVAMAGTLDRLGVPNIRRVVREPERWPRLVALARQQGDTLPERPDPEALAAFMARRRAAEPQRYAQLSLSVVKLLGPGSYALHRPGDPPAGHFGLAVTDYTHSTAPNRRYADLVTQRLLKAALAGAPPVYGDEELGAIAARCTEREDAARKVERTVAKMAGAALLAGHVGEVYDALVTGVKPGGVVFVRLRQPPVDGRITRRWEGVDVGDHVRVRLLETDISDGYIDFERV